jgi:hypothetical protein
MLLPPLLPSPLLKHTDPRSSESPLPSFASATTTHLPMLRHQKRLRYLFADDLLRDSTGSPASLAASAAMHMFTANSTAPFFQQPHARMYPYPPLTAFRSVTLRYAFTSIGRVPDFHPLRSASRRGRPCRPTHGRSGFTQLDTHSTTASHPHTALGLPTPAHPNSKVLYLVRPRSFFDSTVDFATPAHATDEQPALEARRPLYCGTPPRAPTHWVLCLSCPPIRDSPGSSPSMPHHSNEGIMSSTHPYALYTHYHHHQHSATSLRQQPQLASDYIRPA